jgi:hypothetical protein
VREDALRLVYVLLVRAEGDFMRRRVVFLALGLGISSAFFACGSADTTSATTVPDGSADADEDASSDRTLPSGDGAGSPDVGRDEGTADALGEAAPDAAADGSLLDAPGVDGATGVPAFGRVLVLMMENRSLSTLRGNDASAPYINGLMDTYAYATAYLAVTHPSLPNYLALTSGSTQGITCDCEPDPVLPACGGGCFSAPCGCSFVATHLGDQLEARSLEWRAYAEGMQSPCNLRDDNDAGPYVIRHVPFLYYDDVRLDTARCTSRVRDWGDLAADLAAGTYRFGLLTPNLCDDMHDSCDGGDPTAQGDGWMSTHLPAIIATLAPTDVLFVVWDEGDTNSPIPLIVVSPLVQPASTYAGLANHYALLATIEDGLGLPRLGGAVAAHPITGIWK